MLVQRTLSARSLSHAQGACLFAGLLKILPMFVIVLPGMIARVFYPNLLACEAIPDKCAQCCGNSVSCSNFAYPQLVMKLMPTGMRGIMLAGMLAALMSDLTSIFNSSATLFSLDIWHRARPKADSRELLIVGRVWVLVMVIAAVLWVPIVGEKQGGQLFIYIQHIAADLAPPIAAVYLMAILWKRTNETGAFTGLMVGALIGVVRMLLEFTYPAPQCPNPDLRPFVVRLQYMYFALVLFVTSAIVTVVVSLFTEPVEKWRLIRTTYWTRKDQTERPDIYEYAHNNPKINSNIHSGKESTDKMEMETFHFDVSSVPIGNKVEKSEDVVTVKPSYFTSFYSWMCGLESVQMSADAENAMLKSEMKISKLEQDPMAKTLLNIGLVAIISLDIFLYVFFSTYSPIEA